MSVNLSFSPFLALSSVRLSRYTRHIPKKEGSLMYPANIEPCCQEEKNISVYSRRDLSLHLCVSLPPYPSSFFLLSNPEALLFFVFFLFCFPSNLRALTTRRTCRGVSLSSKPSGSREASLNSEAKKDAQASPVLPPPPIDCARPRSPKTVSR